MKKLSNNSHSLGFTLIELLVVISIIALLSSVILATLNVAKLKAQDSRRIKDFQTLKTAFDIFYLDYNHYPCSTMNPLPDPYPYRSVALSVNNFTEFNYDSGVYCPNDPPKNLVTKGIIGALPLDPINTVKQMYVYEALNDLARGPQMYILYTTLEPGNPLMTSDGGLCTKLYEIGNGVGTMIPFRGVGNSFMACN